MAILEDWADVLVLVALAFSIIGNIYMAVQLQQWKRNNHAENLGIALNERRDLGTKTLRIREHAGGEMIPPACYVLGVS